MRRIVVTGLGAVTPLAAGVEASWSRLLAGRSGIRRLPDDVVRDLPAKVGGAVPSLKEDPDAGFDPDAVLAPKDQRKVDRFILFALAAAEEALEQAKWKPALETDRLRTATIIASTTPHSPAEPYSLLFSRRCARSNGWSMQRSRLAGRRPCSPTCRATPTVSPYPIAG